MRQILAAIFVLALLAGCNGQSGGTQAPVLPAVTAPASTLVLAPSPTNTPVPAEDETPPCDIPLQADPLYEEQGNSFTMRLSLEYEGFSGEVTFFFEVGVEEVTVTISGDTEKVQKSITWVEAEDDKVEIEIDWFADVSIYRCFVDGQWRYWALAIDSGTGEKIPIDSPATDT